MTNALTIIRSLIIYSVCVPLAIFVGYLLGQGPERMDFGSIAVIVVALCLPLVPVLLRHHHFLVIACWNVTAVMFFLPGRPNVWIVMAALSLLLSILQHILHRETKFVSAPSVAWPLIFLLAVILITANLTGGIGIKSFGGEAYGGKRYVMVIAGIIGYFAISCRRVPLGREMLYVSVFILGGLSWAISSMGQFVDPSLYFIFAIFPVESLPAIDEAGEGVMIRFGGMAMAGAAIVWYGMARYGLRGMFRLSEPFHFLPFRTRGGFQINQPWRALSLFLGVWISLQGGFRGAAIFFAIMFTCHFFMEGLHRSRALPLVLMLGILSTAIGLPLVSKLPSTVQRALSFLPLQIDPMVRMSAEVSSEWRVRIWRTVLPMVPQYLLLGKGYSMDPAEMAMAQDKNRRGGDNAEGAIIAGDYHSGPLTVIIPLGIWGAIGFLWFLGAGLHALYRNYRYGDPQLRTANIFLLSYFFGQAVCFFTIFGSFHNSIFMFTALVALSISINGGVRGPSPVVATKPTFSPARLTRLVKRPAPSAG